MREKEELYKEAKCIYDKFIKNYENDKNKKSYKEYLESLINSKKYSLKDEAFIRVRIMNFINNDKYTIKSIEPLKLEKRSF